MADESRYRTLVETPEYTAQLYFLADRYSDELLDSALMGVLWGITSDAEGYEKVTWNIYAAKSRSFDSAHPCFVIFFQIISDNEVALLWIEEQSATATIMRVV